MSQWQVNLCTLLPRSHYLRLYKLESVSDATVNGCRAAHDLTCSLGLFSNPSARDGWFWNFEAFRSRGTVLPANYLDLFSPGLEVYKDKAVKYTQGTPRITGSLKCQNLLGGWNSFAPLVVPVLLLKLNFCLLLFKRRKQGTQCK